MAFNPRNNVILLLLLILGWYYTSTGDLTKISIFEDTALTYVITSGVFSERFDKFVTTMRSTRSYHCGRHWRGPWICNPGKELGYRKSNVTSERKDADAFLWFRVQCPPVFDPSKIYICQRGEKPGQPSSWENYIIQNKIGQAKIYESFNEHLNTLISDVQKGELDVECDLTGLENMYPKLRDFFPRTTGLETKEDKEKFIQEMNENVKKGIDGTIFFKKNRGGHGYASKVAKYSEVEDALSTGTLKDEPYVAQDFLDPWLIDGYKFHLRMWVVIHHERPLLVSGHVGHIYVAPISYRNPPPGMEKFAVVTNSINEMKGVKKTLDDYFKVMGFSEFEAHLSNATNRKHTKDNGDVTEVPKNYYQAVMMPQIYDAMRWAISATYTNIEEYIQPESGQSMESTGWYNTTFVTKVCYDFTMTSDAKLMITEENQACIQIEKIGHAPKMNHPAHMYQPEWKVRLSKSLMVRSVEIAEEIHYRKKRGLPFGFKDLITQLIDGVPLIDHTELTHVPNEHRVLCNKRLF